MMPWWGQVSSCLFSFLGSFERRRFGPLGRSPGFTRLFAVTGSRPPRGGRVPAAGITYDPGAAFVTDSVGDSDNARSLRSTPAARSPGWLLGSPSHTRTRRSLTPCGSFRRPSTPARASGLATVGRSARSPSSGPTASAPAPRSPSSWTTRWPAAAARCRGPSGCSAGCTRRTRPGQRGAVWGPDA